MRCFYRESLKVTGWTVFEDLRVAEPQSLPTVLGREEVQRLLASVREPRFATCLRLMYYCGLRISEALRLEVEDILGREKPPRLPIRNAKGGKDRYVPLAAALLEEGVSLRQISLYLGHASLDTTAIYTHLTAISEARTQAALHRLYRPRKV